VLILFSYPGVVLVVGAGVASFGASVVGGGVGEGVASFVGGGVGAGLWIPVVELLLGAASKTDG